MHPRIQKTLVENRLLTAEQLTEAAKASQNGNLIEAITRLGYTTEEEIADLISRTLSLERVHPGAIPENLLGLLPQRFVQRHRIVPIALQGSRLIVATEDPLNGALHDVRFITGHTIRAAVATPSAIKAALDIAERRLPQDGRTKISTQDGRKIDIRVSVIPTRFGEKMVMRLLDQSNLQLDMTKLGFEPEDLKLFRDAIHRSYGIVLVTGPTGSGKSTTLYSALTELNRPEVNIMTAEDPIEYDLGGTNQVQIREDIGLSFAAALRSFLRQDPDVIMVGEIRDHETAQIAIKAALTGHLLLSTLHTNDAPSTATRLLDMGIEPFLVTSSVILIVAQRLARRLCERCKVPEEDPRALLGSLDNVPAIEGDATLYRAVGCSTCNNTGYRGRLAIHEVMPLTEDLKPLILKRASAGEIKEQALKNGMSTLRISALKKALRGLTTIEEATRVTDADAASADIFNLQEI